MQTIVGCCFTRCNGAELHGIKVPMPTKLMTDNTGKVNLFSTSGQGEDLVHAVMLSIWRLGHLVKSTSEDMGTLASQHKKVNDGKVGRSSPFSWIGATL